MGGGGAPAARSPGPVPGRAARSPAHQSGLRALYAVPLLLDDELLGVVHMGSRSSHAFSAEDLLLFRTMAARTTSMIARSRAHAREQLSRAEAEQSLARLRASEAQRKRWEEIFSHLGVGVALVRAEDSVLEDVNAAFARMHGYTREELIGRPLADTFAPESRGVLARHVAASHSKPHHEYESMHLRKDGSRFPVLTHVTAFRDESGKVVQRAATFLDITQRRTAEIERQRLLNDIEAERAWLAAVLDQLPAGVILAEAPSGRMVLGNRQVELILGMPFLQAEHIGEYSRYPGFHLDGRPYAPEEWPLARSLFTGEVVQGEEIELRRPDGPRISLLSSSAPIRDRTGQISSAVVTFVDVTEPRRAETAALQAAEFGEKLIGIVSHDLRNPLNAIYLSVTLLLQSETLSARDQRAAARVAKSADTLSLRVEPGRYDGTWDADRLVQVVSNLGGNALQYSPQDSPVTFQLRDEGESVVLEVHNGGNPISPEALPSLFDPFRRASSAGGGLGLGLYIVEQVVKGHGGRIEVTSTEEAGTAFRVILPRTEPAPRTASSP